MIKKRLQALQGTLLIAVIALLFSACSSSSNPGLNYVPKDANLVTSFNIKQIHDKLETGDINLDSLVGRLKTQDSAFALLSYLNFKNPVLTYVKYKSSVMTGQDVTFGVIGELSDKAGFEKELAVRNPDIAIEDKGDYKMLSFSSEACLVWNDKSVILYGGQNIVEQVPTLFNLKKDASLAGDKHAAEFLNKKGDVNFYSSSQDGATGIPMLSMTKISDLLKGNYGGFSLNFENGQVVLDGEYFYNKTVEDLIKKNPTKDLDKAVLANFPGKPEGLMQITFNLKQIFSFLDYAGVTGMVEGYMKNLDITLDDVADAFSGEIAIAMQSTAGSTQSADVPKVLVVAPLGNKASFDKVMGALEKMGITQQRDGQWYPQGISPEEQWSVHTDSKAIAFSTDKGIMEAFQSGTGKMVYPENLDFSGNTSVGYADLNSIIQEIAAREISGDKAAITAILETMDDVQYSTSNLKGNHATMHMQLNLKDKTKNSLPAIVSLIQRLSDMNNTKMTTPMVIDSSSVIMRPPIEDSVAE